MGSIGETHMTPTQASDEEANLFAMQLANASVLPMVLKSRAIELDLLEIIVKAEPGAWLSPSEIASQLPIRNPDAPVMVDSILHHLASYPILTYSLRILPDGRIERLYGTGTTGVSIAPPCLINQYKVLMQSCKFASEQEINSFIPSHAIFKFLIPVLLALLQVHFQVQKMSPFQTHPANVWGFLAATCVYCLGLGLEMHIKSRCAILGHVLLISGAFSSVSLVSIFLPRSLGWLPFIIWAILPFMVGLPLLMRVYHWLYQEILKVDFFGKFMGSTTV